MNYKLESSNTSNLKNTIEVVEELNHEIETLTDELHLQNSRPRIFWNGIISGLGRVIGATIIFAIIIAILSYLIRETNIEWLRILKININKAIKTCFEVCLVD